MEQVVMDEAMEEREWRLVNAYLKEVAAGNPEAAAAAAVIAGYEAGNADEWAEIGEKVLQKWQSKADHKEVMRSVGLTPEFASRQLKQIIAGSPFDTCRVQALNIATKCLDMQKGTIDAGQGVELIVRRSKGSGMDEPEFENEMGSEKKKDEGKRRRHTLKLGRVGDDGEVPVH